RCRCCPSTVRTSSAHCCSIWMSAHCRLQNWKCWIPDSNNSCSSSLSTIQNLYFQSLKRQYLKRVVLECPRLRHFLFNDQGAMHLRGRILAKLTAMFPPIYRVYFHA